MILPHPVDAAGLTSLNVVGVTATQAIISYSAPDASACNIEVSESQTYSPVVHDVDPALFTGADRDDRSTRCWISDAPGEANVTRASEDADAGVAAVEFVVEVRFRAVLWAAIATSGRIWEAAGAHWEHRQLARHVAPPARLRQLPRPEAAYDLVVRRHLGAFGPATVSDIATWSSIRVPQIRAALGRLRGLRRFTDERGRELIDLAAAPRPDPDTNAPARFLARFDAAILGHAAPERTRILPDAYRKAVIFSAEVFTTFLADGFVAGLWKISATPKQAVLELRPFKRLPRAVRTALVEEGEQLVRFYYPESRIHGVRV